MYKLLTFVIAAVINLSLFGQVKIDSAAFTIYHGDMTLYMDKDTCSLMSMHKVTYKEVKKLSGKRSDKWHKEKPIGPYKNKEPYQHSGYDLGHLTPSNITSYDDSLNYHSFSFFNQAPQLAGFNRGAWAKLENDVEELILTKKKGATIITGVIYDNKHKEYLDSSRVKIPVMFFKVVVFGKDDVYAWIGSNVNGGVTVSSVSMIRHIAKMNGNTVRIIIEK
jgi:DNA/RNA endonuclease G (NUC1)